MTNDQRLDAIQHLSCAIASLTKMRDSREYHRLATGDIQGALHHMGFTSLSSVETSHEASIRGLARLKEQAS